MPRATRRSIPNGRTMLRASCRAMRSTRTSGCATGSGGNAPSTSTGSLRGRPSGRLGGARLGGARFRLRSRYGDDLHPLRCLLRDLLTAGSPEEAGELRLAAFALRLRLRPLRGGGRLRGPTRGARSVHYSGRRRFAPA